MLDKKLGKVNDCFIFYLLNYDQVCRQWFSLFILMIGVALIHITPKEISIGQNQMRDEIGSLTSKTDSLQDITGLAAVFGACLISGFAGVFFERLLKESVQQSVVVRYNIILTH